MGATDLGAWWEVRVKSGRQVLSEGDHLPSDSDRERLFLSELFSVQTHTHHYWLVRRGNWGPQEAKRRLDSIMQEFIEHLQCSGRSVSQKDWDLTFSGAKGDKQIYG